MKKFGFYILCVVTVLGHAECSRLATDVMQDMYNSCLSQYSFSCVKPKALAWISEAVKSDEIRVTDDLTIVKTSSDEPVDFTQQRSGDARVELFDKIDNFLATHSIRINAPSILKTSMARSLLSNSIDNEDLSKSLEIPLSEGNVAEGRGFVKKVMIPFLLGLKFKTTVLVPLAFALIALKTWKATTLGLLSMVLSAAMVIFKFAKPKIVNYEVVHYPHHHVEHHVDHHVDHIHAAPHHIDHVVPHHIDHVVPHHIDHVPHHIDHPPPGWEPHGWARTFDAQDLAYNGQI